uniref:Uncharacterized protein n=1 Tax=Noctiluca scintillans TaxID=2966 RepID=A0A7S1F7D7_NOCSC
MQDYSKASSMLKVPFDGMDRIESRRFREDLLNRAREIQARAQMIDEQVTTPSPELSSRFANKSIDDPRSLQFRQEANEFSRGHQVPGGSEFSSFESERRFLPQQYVGQTRNTTEAKIVTNMREGKTRLVDLSSDRSSTSRPSAEAMMRHRFSEQLATLVAKVESIAQEQNESEMGLVSEPDVSCADALEKARMLDESTHKVETLWKDTLQGNAGRETVSLAEHQQVLNEIKELQIQLQNSVSIKEHKKMLIRAEEVEREASTSMPMKQYQQLIERAEKAEAIVTKGVPRAEYDAALARAQEAEGILEKLNAAAEKCQRQRNGVPEEDEDNEQSQELNGSVVTPVAVQDGSAEAGRTWSQTFSLCLPREQMQESPTSMNMMSASSRGQGPALNID